MNSIEQQSAEAGRAAVATDEPILQVRNLKTVFQTRSGAVPAVNDVSFDLRRGETLGLVGESGCGKSVTSLSILRLIPARAGKVEQGSVVYAGRDLMRLGDEEMRKIRGGEIAMVFQEPMTALNPVLTIGQQIIETILLHEDIGREQARQRAVEMLKVVHIPEAERQIDNYPHQLSGGMRQRAMIAMALSCNPKVLIADEPTTALDVTIQAQILELMQELQAKFGTAIIMITHDLGVIAETAHRVAVMYAGRKVEEAQVEALFEDPIHPYTQGLLQAIPGMELESTDGGPRRRLYAIEGTVPALADLPPGCAFAPRCPLASDICRQEVPPLEEKKPRHYAACWNSPRPSAQA
ncbi:MAG: ABC transporter ATP-binding protein [Reyranellaceae bacterium]